MPKIKIVKASKQVIRVIDYEKEVDVNKGDLFYYIQREQELAVITLFLVFLIEGNDILNLKLV